MVPLEGSVSLKAAELRAKYGIKPPDAIQLASVIYRNSDVFITNDQRLDAVDEIKVLTLKDLPCM